MAATFTPVTMEEIATYLKRAFRVLKPEPGPVVRGEATYDLNLSEKVVVRVFTSVAGGASSAAGVGADAIRIGLYSKAAGRPLKSGKLPIVKRTQGWRDNLRNRIEDEMHDYDDREGYWESRA